ncbi:MAG: hypothetical protein J1F22_03115 [Lachnospiraceae bacterium]|nr:hypothetical protein [Lachnospiraceae bacterium]
MEYIPHPIDLTEVEIDEALEKDLERVAQNIHETWAKQRQLQGWAYGSTYDEAGKKHPCMKEYDELPELEKDMDRATVTQTVKMLLFMGYSIEKRG